MYINQAKAKNIEDRRLYVDIKGDIVLRYGVAGTYNPSDRTIAVKTKRGNTDSRLVRVKIKDVYAE